MKPLSADGTASWRCGRVGRRQAYKVYASKQQKQIRPIAIFIRAASEVSPIDAGWSSPVARQAHNLKVVGSNPTPATKNMSINESIM